MRAPSYRGFALSIAALAAVGLLREAWFHLIAEPVWTLPAAVRAPRPEERYAAVRRLLPPSGEIGYVSDRACSLRPGDVDREGGTRLYQEAQYALAPVVLRYGDARAALVLANLADPADLPRLERERSLVLVRDLGHGLALLRPR